MENEDSSIKVARINARQAIYVAIIVGLVSITTTLIATGNLFPKHHLGTSGDTTDEYQTPTTVLDAPHLAFSTNVIDLSLDQCMDNATEALNRTGYSGMEIRRYFAWIYNGDATGLIWCHTDEDIVIFIGAGKDWARASKTSESLRRSFRVSK